jgi:thiol-disulfide isomerase/thioredoxin
LTDEIKNNLDYNKIWVLIGQNAELLVFLNVSVPGAERSANKFLLTKNSVRRPDDFENFLLLSTSSHTPLITFWTASYCSTCKAVSPLLNSLIISGVGEQEGGVLFSEIEYDSPDIMESGLGMTYMITSMPTLLAFDRGEAMTETKVTDPKMLKDERWLKEWIRSEARRRGNGGGGGSGLGAGIFGGLFGNTR